MRAALLMLAACGGGVDGTPDAVPDVPDVSGIDVLVSSTRVYILPRYVTASTSELAFFPDVGSCASFDSDVLLQFPTKLTYVAIDGVELAPAIGTNQAIEGGGIKSATMFHATDAGIAVDVPLRVGPFIAATNLTASASNAGLVVGWQATGSDSVFVGTAGGYGLAGCRVAGSATSYTFTYLIDPPASLEIDVQAFAAKEITQAGFGPVRVFYGEETWLSYGM